MDTLKVLHVSPSFSSTSGGTTTAIRNILSSIIDDKISVSLVCGTRDAADKSGSNFDCHCFKSFKIYSFSISLIFWALSNVKKFDVVHIHGVFSFYSTVFFVLCKLFNIPYVLTPHGMLNNYGFEVKRVKKIVSWAFLEKFIVRNAAFVHLCSQKESRELIAVEKKIKPLVIYLPFLLRGLSKIATKIPAAKARKTGLFLGRVDPVKNIESLLVAMSFPELDDINLVIAGSGGKNYVNKLKDECSKLGISGRITFLGHVSNPEELFSSVDFFVLPSHSESFGLSVLEAGFAGLPIIVSNGVAVSEVVSGIDNFWITSGIPCDLARVIRSVADCDQSPETAVRQIKQLSDLFDPKLLGGQYYDMYASALRKFKD